jgi:ABC-2 type transport system ATP-binding protein
MLAIECVDVAKSFRPEGDSPFRRKREKVAALQGISFAMPEGECFGILGPNGSGKSTLIRLMCTLLLPDSGQMRVFGRDVVTAPQEVRRLIHRVSVEASFFKKLSAQENLDYAAGLYGLDRQTARRHAQEILDRLGLPRAKYRAPLEEMSRGQQQKVAIARALLTSPTLLLLDEPTTGLDPRSRRDVQAFVEDIRRDYRASIVLCTHDMQEAQRLCDRVAVLRDGRFIALDTPEELAAAHGGGQGLEGAFLALTGEDPNDEEELDA